VIPLKPGSKLPGLASWKAYQDRKPTLDELERWFAETANNVGIVTGKVSGIVVVDVDGPAGEETVKPLGIPRTPTANTPHGRHIFLRHPGEPVPNRAHVAPGVDIRADGGFVVAEPSVVEGARYSFFPAFGLGDAPFATVGLLPNAWMNGSGVVVQPKLPEQIHDGQERWRHLLSLAGTLRNRGMGEAEIVEQLAVFNRNRCRPPKPQADVRRIAQWVVEHDTAAGLREQEQATSSWLRIDLAPVLEGTTPATIPGVLERTDGVRLLYRGKRHLLAGEPEAGKGWIAMRACAGRIALGEPVLYLDFEDSEETAVERLRALGVTDALILESFFYVRPEGPLDLDPVSIAPDATLAIVDGLTEAMQMLGLSPYDNADVAAFYAKVPRPLADARMAVLGLDHVVKDRENRGRWAIGAQHKMAGSDVCFSLEAIRPFGRGLTGGLSRLTLTKDRPGFLRQHAAGRSRLGDVHLDSDGEHVSVRIEPAQDTSETGFRYTVYMERVSRYLEIRGEQTKNAIETDVTGKAEYIRAALVTLEAEGFITSRDGLRGSTLFAPTKPYRESDE
jgi:hypothetical protein